MASISISKKYLFYALAAAAVLAVCFFSYFKSFESYELQTYDWRCRVRGIRPISDKIVLIDIADDSLAELGRWPFDRELHGTVVGYLRSCGVRAIVFDILFADNSESDPSFAAAVKKAGNVYFCDAYKEPKVTGGRFTADQMDSPLAPTFKDVAKGVGYVNVKADEDGKRRRLPPMITYEGRGSFALSLEVAADLMGIDRKQIVLRPKKYLQLADKLRLPLDDDGYYLVNFASRWKEPGTFKHVSYYDILRTFVSKAKKARHTRVFVRPKELTGKICFVGLTLSGSYDSNAVPLESVYPMVGLHANVLNSLLMKDFIHRASRVWNLAILAVLGLLVGFLTARLKPLKGLLALLALIALTVEMAILVFNYWGVWIDMFYPVVLISVLYAGFTLIRVLNEIRSRQVMESELAVASQIQKSFLPENPPKQSGTDIAVFMKPAKAIGGDLYAFIPIDEDSLGVMVGDVSGKGTPAALFMAKVVSEFKFFSKGQTDPAEVLTKLNNAIAAESSSGLFVTLAYAIFHPKSKKMVMSNAGHLPLVVTDAVGKAGLLTAEEGMPIGVMDGVLFSNFEGSIEPGACFAFYSDGVSEARNRKQEEFGVEALQKIIQAKHTETAADILNESVQELVQFIGKAPQHDDITLIVVKITPLKDTVS